jgi:hypothetical protein
MVQHCHFFPLARGAMEVHACCLPQHTSTSITPLGWLPAFTECCTGLPTRRRSHQRRMEGWLGGRRRRCTCSSTTAPTRPHCSPHPLVGNQTAGTSTLLGNTPASSRLARPRQNADRSTTQVLATNPSHQAPTHQQKGQVGLFGLEQCVVKEMPAR